MVKLMNGKVGIVTAGGEGIGRASSLAFAEEGATVVVSDINEKSGNETVKLIKEMGAEASFFKCDVSNESEVKDLVDYTVKTYGRLDWAHNNAGIGAPSKKLHETETEDWDRCLSITTTGVYYSMKYELKAMMESGGGAIVNTSSTSGLLGSENLATYSAAKWGVNGLTKSVALEYGKHNIRVNSICPGMTMTGAVESWMKEVPEQAEALKNSIPLKRVGKPEEQANAAVWLCSDKAAYITGINLPVDGGQTAQ